MKRLYYPTDKSTDNGKIAIFEHFAEFMIYDYKQNKFFKSFSERYYYNSASLIAIR